MDSTGPAPRGTDTFFRAVVRHRLYSSPGNLKYQLHRLFHGISLEGKRVLDVGGGRGIICFYAAARGAKRAVCLEPLAEGSRSTSAGGFSELRGELGSWPVALVREPLQTYNAELDAFDVIVLRNSINHLDERACMQLHVSGDARVTYRGIMLRLARLAAPGATLVVTDCSRHNFFRTMRIRNPFMSTIEWHKHQSPRLWAELLSEVGFTNPRITWSTFNTLRGFGGLIMGNAIAAYMTLSHFQLRMQYR